MLNVRGSRPCAARVQIRVHLRRRRASGWGGGGVRVGVGRVWGLGVDGGEGGVCSARAHTHTLPQPSVVCAMVVTESPVHNS